MLSLRENGLVIGLACPKFGYSLAQHVQKIGYLFATNHAQNCLLAGWAYAKIISAHHAYFQIFPSVPTVTRPLYSISHYLSPFSHTPFSVPDPYQMSQCPFFMALFYSSYPLFLCFLFSFPPSLVICPLSFILARLQVFLGGHTEERIEKYTNTDKTDLMDAVRSS